MGVIRRIEIKNFRSINHLILENIDSDINIFVGKNDIGKSNILRALNLFFKSETDIGSPINFKEDFNKNIKRTSGKGQYIKITLDIKLKYEVEKYVRWSKKWDNEGRLSEAKEVFNDSDELSDFVDKSRAKGWLDRMTFSYVPAIKSPLYFEHLFEELHDLMSTTYSQQFEQNTAALISSIQQLTQEITDELKNVIDIENKISLPADLKAFFRSLDFSLTKSGQRFNLKSRGDGIKARHIPVVLKFMASKAKAYRRGALDIQTIWGFEEPENNLEMSHAFEMANTFLTYSSKIQIFLTTHSPAFYSLKEDQKKVTSWFVDRDGNGFTTCTNVSRSSIDLDEKMGMLAYVTPFIKEKEEEITRHKAENSALLVLVEGLKNKTKVVVLTEDEANNLDRIKSYFTANGFNLNEVEFYSYSGKSNINGALVCADALIKKHPTIKYFVIHRDRDVDGEDFESKFKKSLTEKGRRNYILLMTSGYDLEADYLSEEHIHELYPDIPLQRIKEIIDEATKDCQSKSIDKLFNSLYQLKVKELQKAGQTPSKLNVAKLGADAARLYSENPTRYRYGKTAIGLVKSKIQQELRRTPNLEAPSSKLSNPILSQILQSINSERQ